MKSPNSNTDLAVSVCTSVGFRWLSLKDYIIAVRRMQPDIAIGLVDTPNSYPASLKRLSKAVDRTIRWTEELLDHMNEHQSNETSSNIHIFAPILPLSYERQSDLFEMLHEKLEGWLSGLAIADHNIIQSLPEPLKQLPRLSSSRCSNPNEILCKIKAGIDLVTIPFLESSTDSGIALVFTFLKSTPNNNQIKNKLGVDLRTELYATDLSPIMNNCKCYTCQNHHKAYIHHLLNVKEMLAWVLLQIHNHWVIDAFFDGVRTSLSNGSFETEKQNFESSYQADVPVGLGPGPR